MTRSSRASLLSFGLAALFACGGANVPELPDPVAEAPDEAPEQPPGSPVEEPVSDGTGAFRWVVGDEGQETKVLGLDVDATGNLYVLTQTVGLFVGSLAKYDAEGHRLFRKVLGSGWTAASLGVSTAGEVFVQYRDPSATVLSRFTKDGDPVWSRVLENAPPDENGLVRPDLNRIADVSAEGRIALVTPRDPRTTQVLTVVDANGDELWARTVVNVDVATFDADHRVRLGIGGNVNTGIHTLDANGEPLWDPGAGVGRFVLEPTPAGTPPTGMQVLHLGVTRLGTAVASALYVGKVRWGPFALPEPDQGAPPYDHPVALNAVLFAAESDGAARFATVFENEDSPALAVDPSGRAFVSTRAGLSKYDLEGHPLWTREVSGLELMLVPTPDHGVILGGRAVSAADVAPGTLATNERPLLVHYGP